MWFEFSRAKGFEPKTYLNIVCEMGLALHVALLHLLEIGSGGNSLSVTGPEGPLDFRSNFLQTWLGITLMGSLSVSLGENFTASVIQV
jgi:hypothetical protein